MVTLFQTLHTLSLVTADRVTDRLTALKEEETGASAVEYAVLVGIIAAVLVIAVTALGGRITAAFNAILP